MIDKTLRENGLFGIDPNRPSQPCPWKAFPFSDRFPQARAEETYFTSEDCVLI